MMKDYLGQELEIGDEVCYQTTGKGRGMNRGEILKITPKGVTIDRGTDYSWCSNTINRKSEWVVKVPEGL